MDYFTPAKIDPWEWADGDETTVRVVREAYAMNREAISGDTAPVARTAVQAHSDAALDAADLEADNAFRALAESVAWAQSIGVEVPKKVRDATTILAQWQTHLADERKRRG